MGGLGGLGYVGVYVQGEREGRTRGGRQGRQAKAEESVTEWEGDESGGEGAERKRPSDIREIFPSDL